MALFVAAAIVSDTRSIFGATAGLSGFGDGILHCAVTKPASIAPVQTTSPGIKQLIKGSDTSILVQTGLHGIIKGHAVAANTGGVWEHDT